MTTLKTKQKAFTTTAYKALEIRYRLYCGYRLLPKYVSCVQRCSVGSHYRLALRRTLQLHTAWDHSAECVMVD